MDIITLPQDRPDYEITATLDGADFVLRLRWNMRGGWFLGLSDANGDVIFSPKRLVTNWDMLLGVTDARAPLGVLALVDTTRKLTEPTYESLGVTHVLTYTSVEDL